MATSIPKEDIVSGATNIYPFPGSQEETPQPVNQTSRAQTFALMLEMLSIMNDLSAELIQLYGKQQERDEQVAQANQTASEANYQNVKQQTDAYIKQVEEQESESFWQKMLGDVLPVLTVLAAFVFFGPGAALAVGLMTAVSMSLDPSSPIGFAGTALSSVLGDKGEFYFSIGMTVAMTLMGAGAASLLSKFDTIAEVAENAASRVVSGVGRAVENAAVDIEEDAEAIGNAVEEEVGNAAQGPNNAPKPEPTPEQKLAKFQSARSTFLGATGFSTAFTTFDPFMAGINAYGSDDLKKAQWVEYLDLALKLLVSIVAMCMVPSEGADASIVGWKGASNLALSKALTLSQKFLNLGNAGIGIAMGITTMNIGDIQQEMNYTKALNPILEVAQTLVDQDMQGAANAIQRVQAALQRLYQSSRTWFGPEHTAAEGLKG